MAIEIRKATIKDIPAIHQLVKELAIYEKEGDAVTATVEDYQRDFLEELWDGLTQGVLLKGLLGETR